MIAQKYEDWEAIIVDDDSDNDARNVYGRVVDPRFRRIRLDIHRGRSYARNIGIEHARGNFICFLDSDDLFHRDHLEVLFNAISSWNIPEAIYRVRLVRDEGKLVKREPMSTWNDPLDHFSKYHAGIHSFAIPANALRQIRFPEKFSFWEDYHVILRLLCGHKLIQLNEYTAVYNCRDQGTPWKEFDGLKDRIDEQLACIEDLRSKMEVRFQKRINWKFIYNKTIFSFSDVLYKQRRYKLAARVLAEYKIEPISAKEAAKYVYHRSRLFLK
jgi:glycosyltransferase involved in cell wall biosynthesis